MRASSRALSARSSAERSGRRGGRVAMSDDRDAIHFPEAETIPSFAIAFMGMMFAHAEFEEQVRELQASIMKTPAKLDVDPKITDGDLGKSRDRPKRMANLIKDRPGLVNDQEEKRIVEILKAAIAPCCWRAPNDIR